LIQNVHKRILKNRICIKNWPYEDVTSNAYQRNAVTASQNMSYSHAMKVLTYWSPRLVILQWISVNYMIFSDRCLINITLVKENEFFLENLMWIIKQVIPDNINQWFSHESMPQLHSALNILTGSSEMYNELQSLMCNKKHVSL